MAAEDIWQVRGQRFLSGIFGVEKAGETVSEHDSKLCLRLMFNLRPSNAAQELIHGDLDQLPTSARWSSLQLEEYQILFMSSSDRQCFFCLFSMSPDWAGSMALMGDWPRDWFAYVPAGIQGDTVKLAVRGVPPWAGSVPWGFSNMLTRTCSAGPSAPRARPLSGSSSGLSHRARAASTLTGLGRCDVTDHCLRTAALPCARASRCTSTISTSTKSLT